MWQIFSLIFCDIGIGPDIIPIDSYIRYVTQALMIIAYCIMWIAFIFKKGKHYSFYLKKAGKVS